MGALAEFAFCTSLSQVLCYLKQFTNILNRNFCWLTGGSVDCGRGWQPYADHLVYSALAALPWGGSELAESAPAEVCDLAPAVSSTTPYGSAPWRKQWHPCYGVHGGSQAGSSGM